MKELNPKLIKIISEAISGKRLEHFINCVNIINESLALGGWTSRGSVKSQKGFSQGITNYIGFDRSTYGDYVDGERVETEESRRQGIACNLARALSGSSGSSKSEGLFKFALKDVEEAYEVLNGSYTRQGKEIKLKVSVEVAKAWIELCDEVKEARIFLDTSRPLPVITEVGVSPRVTRTLDDMGMGASSYSVKLAELERREKFVDAIDKRTGKKIKKRIVWYVVVWSEDIIHNQSRFSLYSCNCDACGKKIPSGRFVAMELHKDNGEKLSMWVGTDCAKNLFGIKDVGVERPQEEK